MPTRHQSWSAGRASEGIERPGHDDHGHDWTRPAPAGGQVTVRKPAAILDYELCEPARGTGQISALFEHYERVWLIVRAHGRPIDVVDSPSSQSAIESHIARYRGPASAHSQPTAAGFESESDPTPNTPSITVAICTRDRPKDLARLLQSLQNQTLSRFQLIVVDNCPTDDSTRDVVDYFGNWLQRLRYVVEPTPGLSQARNRALRNIDTDLVAWIDDDEVADPIWLATLVDAFRAYPEAAAVSGSVVPAELETRAQWWFEQYGGHSKGRGFTRAVFRSGQGDGQSPVYPLPPFGVGANMAFRLSSLIDLGGFDTALGAGTPTFGGEDLLIFSQLLLSGGTVLYEPAAMTRHYHRRTLPELENQMFGYGVGLTAYYTALLRWDWRLISRLIGLLPRATADILGRNGSAVTAQLPDDFPVELVRIKRQGMLRGPVAYWRARRHAAKLAGAQ